MWVKTIKGLCRFLYFFTFAVDRRKCTKQIVFGVIFLLSALTIGSGYARTWRDDFDDIDLNGWERIVEENPWHAEWEVSPFTTGHLYAFIIGEPELKHVVTADFLHWNVHEFQLDKVTVVADEIRYSRNPMFSGELCLFLGKRQPSPDFAEGYIFSPEKTTRMQFTEDGVYKKGEVKDDYALMFRLTIEHLKVVFEAGKFQLWTQDLTQDFLIKEFFDDNIPMIDIVGLMSVFEPPGLWFDGTISTFSISGIGIPTNNSFDVQLGNTQLTTTWGKLKDFKQGH